MNKFTAFAISIITILLDQLTKLWIIARFSEYDAWNILPVFTITRVHNYGAGWSFLSDAGGWQRWFFMVVSIAVSLVIVVVMLRLHKSEKWLGVTFALVLGGAIGNLIDRISYGYVVDFISVHYAGHFFPVFNVADIAISLGAMMIVIDAICKYRKAKNENIADGS